MSLRLYLIAVPPYFLPHSHLDNHSLWEPKVFAIRCFKIIMYSIQVGWLPCSSLSPGHSHLWEQTVSSRRKPAVLYDLS